MKKLYFLLVALMAMASGAMADDNSVGGHEFVDLGLPTGTLWATCNVGANSPEEYGDYFAWAETEAKSDYSWSTYRYSRDGVGTVGAMTKYNETDGEQELLPEDDAATANWGDRWQMPSTEQIAELFDSKNTTYTMTTQNGVSGLLVTSKKNGKEIFLPASGYYDGTTLKEAGTRGYYWSRFVHDSWSYNSYALDFQFVYGMRSRSYGQCVRPVCTPQPYAYLRGNGTELVFCYDNFWHSRTPVYELNTGSKTPGWKSEAATIKSVSFMSSFADARPTTTHEWFCDMKNLTSITGISYLNTSKVTNMRSMFNGCESLTSLDLSHFNTENVTNMYSMFNGCKGLQSLDLRNFNTANVTDMGEMFHSCEGLTSLNVSRFNTKNVVGMAYMFARCKGLQSLDVSNFNTSNVTNMHGMFFYCKALTSLNVDNFNTENVTDMGSMFKYCSGLQYLDASKLNTTKVTNMNGMFSECLNMLVIDLSGFNTTKVTNMEYMFSNCWALTSLDLCSFNTYNVEDASCMFMCCYALQRIYVSERWTNRIMSPKSDKLFFQCESLVGGQGTAYNKNNIGVNYAQIDGGPENPGYLTYKYMYDFVSDGIFYYITGDNTVEVTYRDENYNCYSGNVTIPSSVERHGITYKVTSIHESAFRNCTGLTEVTIPASVTVIGDYAFNGCSALAKITCLCSTPPTVSGNTFSRYNATLLVPEGCKSAYQSRNYWKNFTNIQERTHYDFYYAGIYYLDMGGRCSAAVTYKDSDYGTYSGDVVIPEDVVNSENLMPYTVSQIAERAFYRCPSLKSVTIPATVDLIDSDAFLDSFIEFPTESSITCLAQRPPTVSPTAFSSGISLMTLYVLKGCKAAYEAAAHWKDFGRIVELPYHFKEKKIFYAITGDNTVSVVNRDANYNSYEGEVMIPAKVTYKGVTYTVNKIANVAFLNCPELTSVDLPSTITAIGNRSFKDCTRLRSITIPENVQNIGVYAFDGCTALNEITCLATEPPTIDYTTFTESCYQGASLYVPYGCHDAYMYASVWELFYDIFELPDGLDEIPEAIENGKIYNLAGQRLQKMQKGINIVNGRKILVK